MFENGQDDWSYKLLQKNEFAFDHIGNVFESGEVIFGVRSFLELTDFLRDKAGKEKWDPRVKMWISVIAGMVIPSALETIGYAAEGWNTPDVLDSFGPALSLLLVGGSWELVNFLTDSETALKAETLKQKFHDGAVNIGTMIEDRVDLLVASKDSPTASRISNALEKIMFMTETFTAKMDAIDMDKYTRDLDLEVLADRSLKAMARLFNRSRE